MIVDNNSVGTASSYTFKNINANHTISASFANNVLINAFPVPFNKELNIDIKSNAKDSYDILISDMSGKIVCKLSKIAGNTITPVEPGILPGVYIMGVYHEGKLISAHRIIKN